MALRFNKNFDVNRVVKRLVYTILALYVGGTVIQVFGDVMNGTCSSFYSGLSLIGWTIGNGDADSAAGCTTATGTVITATTGTGVLAVVGIIAIAQIVTEFISY